jgi:hypothetical protein
VSVVAGALALAALLTPDPSAAGSRTSQAAPPAASACTEAGLARVRLDRAAAVDEIRVQVAPGSPTRGAATVTVEAGLSDRVVRVLGDGARGLRFSHPLTAREFRVALDPVFDASASACVEGVVLLHHGKVVATVAL